ncbi:MAG: hypothetical protein ACLQAH_07145 [Limisphaerales bacterium]
MATLPFFVMPKKQVEDILAKLTPQDRERVEKGLKHSRTLYNLSGDHIPHDFEKEKLLDVLSQRDTYVVDSNSDWKKECKEHLDKAFIISPSLARENPNTRDLILEATRSKLGNIFSVGIDARINCVLVERIDEYFQYEFDIPKLSEASREKGETFAKQKKENRKSIEDEKGLIRAHIGNELFFAVSLDRTPISLAFGTSGKASDLPTPQEMPNVVSKLKAQIKRRLPECKYNIKKSKRAIELCYATLLVEDTEPKGIRWEFDEPDYEHVFGDMYIVQTAIYLGAKVLTRDRKLSQMACYAGIKCCHVPEVGM